NVAIDGDGLLLTSDDEYKLKALIDILQSKLTRRDVSLLALDYGKVEPAAKGTVRQRIAFKQGVDADTGRKIIKMIKDLGLKVQTQYQGDQVRVTAKAKDDLQAVIQKLRAADLPVPVQFTNYR